MDSAIFNPTHKNISHTDNLRALLQDTRWKRSTFLALLPQELIQELLKYLIMVRWRDPSAEVKCVGSLEGHTAEVKALAFLSENLVASGSFDRTVRVWDLCTGQCIRVFEGHTAKVWCVEKAKEKRVASGGADGLIYLWNVETGKAVRKLTGHHGPVYSLAAAPHRLASSSQDHTIRIWSLESGRCVRVLHGHTGAVFGVSVWQDWLASCSTDSTVRVWNLHSGQCIRTLSVSRLAHGVTYYCVDILEGLVVSGCFEEVVNGWDVASGRLIFTLGQQSADKKAPFLEIGEASVSEVKIIGKTVVFSSWHENYNIHILDYHTRESIRQLRGHSRRVRCLRVHPNTFTMITGGDDGTIKIWKLY